MAVVMMICVEKEGMSERMSEMLARDEIDLSLSATMISTNHNNTKHHRIALEPCFSPSTALVPQ
jgi:hypothetical protein